MLPTDGDELHGCGGQQGAHHVAAAPVRGGHRGGDPLLHYQHGVRLQPGPALHEVRAPGLTHLSTIFTMSHLILQQALYLMTTAVGNLITMVIVEIFSAIGLEQVGS